MKIKGVIKGRSTLDEIEADIYDLEQETEGPKQIVGEAE